MPDEDVPVEEVEVEDKDASEMGDQWGIGEILEEENTPDSAEALAEEVRAAAEEENEEAWSENQFEEEVVEKEEEDSWLNEDESEESANDEVESESSEVVKETIEESTKNEVSKETIAGDMILGTRRDDGSSVAIPSQVLARHAAMLGSTGSGKTVMAKALIEEATLAGIPSLILDPQGDLARLAMGLNPDELNEQGGDVSRRNALMEKAEVRIWTPLRSKGLPICIDPFVAPPAELGVEEAITAWDMVAAGFTGLADYDVEKAQGKQVKPFIYEILVHGAKLGLPLDDFQKLSKAIRDPHATFLKLLYPEAFEAAEEDEEEQIELPTWDEVMDEHGLPHYEDMLPKSTRSELSRRIAAYSSGVNQLLFANGTPLDIDTFCTPAVEGKIPVNILYLNTIQDDAQKQYMVQEVARELYDWMLTQQPSEGELKLLFFMDEVAPYLPPHPRNPPAKDLIKLIFKQARKYGVASVLATQNVSDVDYKILAQANSMFIGRFRERNDIDKVKHLLKEGGGDVSLIDELPKLSAGQFQLVSPDVSDEPIPIQCRWLYTDHGAPLSEEQVEEITDDEVREWASGRSRVTTRDGAAAATAAIGGTGSGTAGKGGRGGGVVSNARVKSVGGMTAAAHGVVDDSAFEVRLMGGLAVLKDGRDPLYVMQALTNVASGVALAWAMVAVLLAWQDNNIEWWWMVLSFIITSTVGLVIGLEMFLSHDATLQKKISRFARSIQYILAAWLWTVLVWERSSDSIEMGWGSILLEMTVIWVSLFIVVELINRFKLGRLEFKRGHSAFATISKNLKSMSAMMTGMQFNEMKASSKQVLAGIRWVLDFCTLLLLASIVTIGWTSDGNLSSGLADMGGDAWILKPALWLGSLYLLIFISETWLRLKDKPISESE
ncbi:MAG: hypothetical protein CMB49_06275 [Euryarchaeota archaeon]|nr:hypothetical protein [Euryarchaeota archaeon]